MDIRLLLYCLWDLGEMLQADKSIQDCMQWALKLWELRNISQGNIAEAMDFQQDKTGQAHTVHHLRQCYSDWALWTLHDKSIPRYSFRRLMIDQPSDNIAQVYTEDMRRCWSDALLAGRCQEDTETLWESWCRWDRRNLWDMAVTNIQ